MVGLFILVVLATVFLALGAGPLFALVFVVLAAAAGGVVWLVRRQRSDMEPVRELREQGREAQRDSDPVEFTDRDRNTLA